MEFVASTRINRYELGAHKPDYLTAQNLAAVLGVSTAFLYSPEDEIAELLFRYQKANKTQRSAVLQDPRWVATSPRTALA